MINYDCYYAHVNCSVGELGLKPQLKRFDLKLYSVKHRCKRWAHNLWDVNVFGKS